MPDTALYCSLDELKTYMGIPVDDTTDDARLESMIVAASRAVDLHCHRRFYPYEETRRYDAQAQRVQSLDHSGPSRFWWADTMRKIWVDRDLISISALINGDGTTISDADFILYPLNGPPFRSVELRLDRGVLLQWQNTPQAAFSIVGTWGYVTPDSEGIIPHATMLWAEHMVQLANFPGVQSTSIGSYSVSFSQKAEPAPSGSGQPQLRPPVVIAQMLEGLRYRDYASTFL